MLCRFVLLVVLGAAGAASAQTDLRGAETALAEGRFAEATAAAEQAVRADGASAEALYLLGRVLFDAANPARDVRRARRAVERASNLEPDNVLYLVARLETLRGDARFFWGDLRQARLREQLARRILQLDPENGFAHEELGVQSVRDYYQYRNAIAFPTLAFAQPERVAIQPLDPTFDVEFGPQIESAEVPSGDVELTAPELGLNAAGAIASANRLDIDQIDTQGGASVSYAARAQSAYAEAITHLTAAQRRDPRRRSVYEHLVRLGLLAGDFASVAPVVLEMLTQFDDDPRSWMYAGLVAHRQGAFESARDAFAKALEQMTTEDRAAFEDLSFILPVGDLPAYQADREGFARRYWTARDPRFLNQANERQTEHYARLVAADLLFRSEGLALPGWRTERGALYVRYGPPTRDIIIDGGYGTVLEAFPGRLQTRGTQLAGEVNRFNVWDYGDFEVVFEDPNRNGEFRLYSPPADLFGSVRAGEASRMDYVVRVREAVRREPERYRFEGPGRVVDLPYRVSAFRSQGAQADVYLVYGIPLAVPSPRPAPADVEVTLRTGAFLVSDDHQLTFERRRTVYGLRASQIIDAAEARLWTGVETLAARPGQYEVSFEFETAGGGTSAVQRRTVTVPDFSAPGLHVSDLLLAYSVDAIERPSVPGRVVRNGQTMVPAPWGVFGVDEPVFLYFEIYGLTPEAGQTDYEVEARLVPQDTRRGVARTLGRLLGGRARGVGTTSEAQGDAADDWQNLALDARGQAPGLYTLTVVVRDRHTGQSASRETTLLLE